ncbi:hypothetical protein JCM10449v2_001742 [Rhodotorula kratochvilovae]
MRLSAFAALATALLPSLVSATYFTSPAAGATWDEAAGQVVTWKFQPGGAPRGDIILQSTSSNPKAAQTKVVAMDVDLTSESVTVPAGLSASSATSWTLLMVNSNNYGTVYSQVGPFTIASFAGSAGSSSAAPPSTTAAGGAVGNGSGQDDTATNPAVGTSTAAPSSRTTRPSSSSRAATTAAPVSSSPSASRSPASSSSRPPSSSRSPPPSSTTRSSSPAAPPPSSATSAAPLVTATVISTASGVEITSTLTGDSASLANATSAGGPVSLVTVTASDSSAARSTATFISAPASAATGGAGGSSGAGRREVGWAAALGAIAVAVWAS